MSISWQLGSDLKRLRALRFLGSLGGPEHITFVKINILKIGYSGYRLLAEKYSGK